MRDLSIIDCRTGEATDAENPYAVTRIGDLLTKEEPTGGAKSEAEKAADLVKEQFDKAIDKVKEIAEGAKADAAAGRELATGTKEKADEAIVKMNELKEQVDTLAQKVAAGDQGGDDFKSLGEQFAESDSFKELIGEKGGKGRASIELKATLTSLTTDAGGSVGDLRGPALRVPGVIELPQRRMTIRDLITPGQMDTNSLEYVRETGWTNGAGMVAEGAGKPASDIKLALKTTSAKVIAHYMKASRQIMDDAAQLRSLIDNRLLYGLALKEEGQILNGDGNGQNLLGIIPQATAYAEPFAPPVGGAWTAIDIMRLAILQAVLAEYPATGHVMHPIDWTRIELTKDEVGRYIIGNPQDGAQPTLWRLPVVATQAITVDKFLTGAFKLGAQLFDRWLARIELATENEDDFIKNLVTILGEERLALAVFRPESFIYGDLGFVA